MKLDKGQIHGIFERVRDDYLGGWILLPVDKLVFDRMETRFVYEKHCIYVLDEDLEEVIINTGINTRYHKWMEDNIEKKISGLTG